jgi:hypothetical protein
MNPSFRPVFALILGLMLSPIAHAETTNVSVTIDVVNAKSPVISVTYGNNSRQLTLADDAAIEIDGKKSDYRALLPGDKAVVTYDKVRSAVTKVVVQRDAIAPAEALAEGWQEIDQRLIFLMIRLANVEASLEAVERAIDADNRKRSGKANTARKADRDNEALDRKGGGPVKWSQFYGMTAEKFFYHPTDRNTTYHTETILSQQGSPADNKVGGGVPAGQGLPVHQRPPQFDYIYRANDSAKARAEMEASELVGKIDALNERRQRLEAEQAGLWVEIAFRAISHYDLDQKPAYRFEPLLNDLDADYVQRTEVMKSAASFMALALSIIGEAEKNQQGTFLKLKPAVAKGRQTLNDSYLRLAVDNSDSQSSVGRFVALAKRLDDISANLTDSYSVATEGDLAGDQLRKDTFRAMLQSSLINYAQIILAMDEMAELMKEECKFRPNVDKSIRFVGLANVEGVSAPLLPRPQRMLDALLTEPEEDTMGRLPRFEASSTSIANQRNSDEGSLASTVIGMYQVSLVNSKAGLREIFLDFQNDFSLRYKGDVLGSWDVVNDKLTISLLKPEINGSIKFSKSAMTGNLADSTGASWRLTGKRLTSTTWDHTYDNKTGKLLLWSNGRLGMPDSNNKWAINGNNLTFTWSSGFVDRCTLSPDKRRYEGKNNIGFLIFGKLIEE